MAQRVRVLACVGMVLVVSAAMAQSAPVEDQIAQHEQKLAAARSAKNVRAEGTELNILGMLNREAGKPQKAVECLNDALTVERSMNNQPGQAMSEDILGRVYTDVGQEGKAQGMFRLALQIWRTLEVGPIEANTLTYMAVVHNNLGERKEALADLNAALAIWHGIGNQPMKRTLSTRQRFHDLGQLESLKELGDAMPKWQETVGRAGEADTLDNLGQTYSGMGQAAEAFQYFNQALPIWREVGNQGGEALTLNNMGRTYADLGQKQNSLGAFTQSLRMFRAIGNRQGEALTLNNMGRLYRDLGEQQTALDYYNQALPIFHEAAARNGEALALNDIGRAYADMKQPQKALEFCEQALPLWRETGNRRGEAMTLNNMGRDYSDLQQPDKALEFDSQALPLWREVGDRRGEALDLMTLGWTYAAEKEWEQALVSELAALSIAKTVGDPEIQGGVETSLMIGFRNQHLPDEAIFFGMDAVNAYQQIRRNISSMAKDLQAGFAQSKSTTYRILAELLIETGELGEAEEILDMLKEQELSDIVRGAGSEVASMATPLKVGAAQLKAQSEMAELEKKLQPLHQLSVEAAELQAKAARTPEEDVRLKTLDVTMAQEAAELQAFFDSTVSSQIKSDGGPGNDNSAQSYLQETLAKLGPRVVGVRLLLGESQAYEIVVTATSRKKIELKVTPAELRSKVFEALKVMGMRSADPKPQLAQLYSMIVAPLDDELKALDASPDASGHVPTLLWSLDDALRYLPMAALYDGRHYMVERYNNVLFTPESYGHMLDSPLTNGTAPTVLAMGLSRSYGGLPALPGVMRELDSVVHDPAVPESHGPMEGKLLPDDKFTLATLKAELGAGKGFPVVHIASHFVVEAGSGSEPYLMLGGNDAGEAKGFAWDLSDLENSAVAFHGTRLLTLSACSTGKDYTSRNGLEMDSLGMVAQQKDAEAVLATLWDVNDASTSRLMSDFYDRWVKHAADGKAEALRQAQIAFLHGTAVSADSGSGRGFATVPDPTLTAHEGDYSHPFYWAPFVLVGNYQ